MTNAKTISFGGITAALAIVIMCLGGIIPVATYVCPMICCILSSFVVLRCGRRIALSWHFVVAICSLLMSPDMEAAFVFSFLGYYPLIKPWMDSKRSKWILKIIYFNSMIGLLYYLLIGLFGFQSVAEDFQEVGEIMTFVMLILGNVIFFLLDFLLDKWKGMMPYGK